MSFTSHRISVDFYNCFLLCGMDFLVEVMHKEINTLEEKG